jgi:hypothetical protein
LKIEKPCGHHNAQRISATIEVKYAAVDSDSDGLTIPDQAIENLLPLWILTAAVNAFAIYVAAPRLTRALHSHTQFDPTLLLIPIGLVFLLLAAYRTRRAVKFGESVLLLHKPPEIGGEIEGTIQVASPVESNHPVELRLHCVRHTMSGGKSGTTQTILWRQSQTVADIALGPHRTEIPIHLTIPDDAQPAGKISDFPRCDIRWTLEAHRPCSGIGYRSRFAIPVRAPQSDQPAPTPAEPIPEPHKQAEPGITVERLSGGLQIHLAAGRRKPLAPAIFGIIATLTAIVLLLTTTADLAGALHLAFGLLILLIGGLFDYIAIYNLLVSQSITAHPGSVIISRHAPFYTWTKTFNAGDIAEITFKSDGASGSGAAQKTYFGIQLKTRDGKTTWIANNISNANYAAWLAQEISRIAGAP